MGLRAYHFIIVAAVLSAASAVWSQPTPWPTLQSDERRTGRATGAGAIVKPSVAWEVNTGGQVSDRAVLIDDINSDESDDYLVIVGGAVVARRFDRTLLWDTPSLGLSELVSVSDFNGDGRSEVLAIGSIAVLLDGPTGRELWRFENTDGVALRSVTALVADLDDDPQPELLIAVARPPSASLHDFSSGFADAQRWLNTDPALPSNVSRPVIGDFKGEGDLMMAIVNQSQCQLVFVELSGGETERVTESLTVGGFCYGLTQAVNLDEDPQQELVFTGSFGQSSGSVSLTVYDYPSDQKQWQHEYATDTALTSSLAPAGAITDMDGDGRAEVAISVFNNGQEVSGDDGVEAPGAWSTTIYDGATGQPRGSVRDRVVLGFADLVPGGGVELIVRETVASSVRIPNFGTLEVLGLDDDGPRLLHSLEQTRPLVRAQRAADVNSRDNGVLPAIFENDDGPPTLLILKRTEAGNRLQSVELTGPRPAVVSDQQAPPGVNYTLLRQTGDVAGESGPHVVLKTNVGVIEARDASLSVHAQLSFTGHVASALLAPTESQDLTLVYRDSAKNLVAIDPTLGNRSTTPPELWRKAAPRRSGFTTSVDIDGDGLFEIINSEELDDGTPYLEALSPGGERLWRAAFEEAAGLPFALVTGNFNSDGDKDVAALLFTLDGAALTRTFDGRTGALIAEREANEADVQRNPNRELFPLNDLNGDGIDELLLLHYTSMERLDGRSLEREGPVVSYPPQTARPANSSLLSGSGQVFLNLFTTQKAVIGEAGLTWSVPSEPSHDAAEAGHAGLSDADGDGLWDIAIPGHLGDITVLSGLDGGLIRRLCLTQGRVDTLDGPADAQNCAGTTVLSSIVTADIDGDGDEDHIVGTSEGWLYAVDVPTGGRIWSIFLNASIHDPMVADIDSDGDLEVVVSTADSRLVALDNSTLAPVAEVREVLIDSEDSVVSPGSDIDISARVDALGVAWDPVRDAEGYLVTILSENLNEVTDPVEVDGTQTSLVVTDLNLIPGARYITRIVPFNARSGSAAPAVSDGVLIIQGGPNIVGFEFSPDPFDTFEVDSAQMVATVTAPEGLQTVKLIIFSLEDAFIGQVYEQTFLPGAETILELNQGWDGRDDSGPLPEGVYRAQLTAFDTLGAGTADTETFELRHGDSPPLSPAPPVTVAGTGGEEPCCACQSPAGGRAPGPVVLPLFLLLSGLLLRTRR